jgi:hypothetical protein
LSGTTAIEIVLDVFDSQRQQRRAAIDHAADRNPMAFAEGRDPEQMAEGVEGHLVAHWPLLTFSINAKCQRKEVS